MLQGKWKAQICYALCIQDVVRFGMLKRELPGITNTMLTTSLRELERDGLVFRKQYNEVPPHVEYSFTEMGRDLMPIFYQIMLWNFGMRMSWNDMLQVPPIKRVGAKFLRTGQNQRVNL